jgi:flavin-dependent dehydrogenase
MFCVRRSTLDPVLIEAAVEAGADFRPATAVTDLVVENDRVTGVETATGQIRAALVVGADGPHSTVARLAGAREYHTSQPGRLFMWGYFEGVVAPEPCLWLAKTGDLALLAAPTDGDLFLVAVVPSLADKARYLADTTGSFLAGLSRFEQVAAVVGDAKLAGPVRTMARWHGYFRDATGPGWVLAGDAGHFKDPTPGQGIADAFRQVERLAPAIRTGLSRGTLDAQLESWGRWRDQDAWEMYWFATDIGAPGVTPPIVIEMIRQVVASPRGGERFLKVLDHDLAPSKVFSPWRAMSAAVSLAAHRSVPVRSVGRELGRMVHQEVSRARSRRQPVYAEPEPAEAETVAR